MMIGGIRGIRPKPIPQFKKGGKVMKTGLAVVHSGEYVLPKGVKPTKAQKKKVNKMKN